MLRDDRIEMHRQYAPTMTKIRMTRVEERNESALGQVARLLQKASVYQAS